MRNYLALLVLFFAAARQLQAWGAAGHILVTQLAIKALPPDFPDWAKTPENEDRLLHLCNEPDRWRGHNAKVLNHINFPDHQIDSEDLADYGLTLASLPRFRNEFIEQLAVYRDQHPQSKVAAYDPSTDRDHTRSIPGGFLPWAMEENRLKIAASWTMLKTYAQYPDVVTPEEIANERANIIFYMGLLSHFVGDSVQPLHTTRNYNGWIDANPHGYTTSKEFHAYIDEGILKIDAIGFAGLGARARPPEAFNPVDTWAQILADIAHTNAKVEPLYQLQKSGDLEKAAGKAFIEDCFLEGGSRLSGLWIAAWKAAQIDPFTVRALEARRTKAAAPAAAK